MYRLKLVLLVGLSFMLPSTLAATTLPQFVSIGFSGPSSPMFLPPFHHTLGTLDSVEVTIDGTVSATVQTFPLVSIGGPIPSPFSVSVDQNFTGISSHSFFSFVIPSTFVLSGLASGAGEVQSFSVPFVYGLHFDSSTDLLGFTAVSAIGPAIPPGLAYGTLAGFADTFSPLMMEFMVMSPGAAENASLASFSSEGAILVEYDYTPAPAPVPEPASLLLLGSGLAGAAGAIRRRLRG